MHGNLETNSVRLLDQEAVCSMLGGSRPIHVSSLYRYIRQGVMPRPVHIGASSRWVRTEVEAALAKMMEARS
jgi:predicted DNA-binding transcriptional regulator AlpA